MPLHSAAAMAELGGTAHRLLFLLPAPAFILPQPGFLLAPCSPGTEGTNSQASMGQGAMQYAERLSCLPTMRNHFHCTTPRKLGETTFDLNMHHSERCKNKTGECLTSP